MRGWPRLWRVGRRSGVMAAAAKYLPPKKSAKGLGQDQMVESFVLLSALGGDCIDDFDGLRRDYGLRALVGYTLPSAPTARQWPDRFHEEALTVGLTAAADTIFLLWAAEVSAGAAAREAPLPSRRCALHRRRQRIKLT